MQCGVLGQILEQNKDTSGKSGEVQGKSRVQLIVRYQRSFPRFDSIMVMHSVNDGELGEGYTGTLTTNLAIFLQV